MTFGTPGVAHIGHLMGELMQAMAGVKLEHIPYRGGADAARDLAAGRIDAVFISESSLRPVLDSGKAKPIGVTGTTRRPEPARGTPAIAEVLPGYDLSTWILVFAPAGTPEAVQQRLAAAFRAATTDARRPGRGWRRPAATRRWRRRPRRGRCSPATRR